MWQYFRNYFPVSPLGGVIAVQMPAMPNEPVRALQLVVASSGPWFNKLLGFASASPILKSEAYYDLLSGRVSGVEIWVTQYLHVLRGEEPVVQPENRKTALSTDVNANDSSCLLRIFGRVRER